MRSINFFFFCGGVGRGGAWEGGGGVGRGGAWEEGEPTIAGLYADKSLNKC